jgi:hypothetical protein
MEWVSCSEVVLTNADGVQREDSRRLWMFWKISRGHVSVGKGDSAMRAVSQKRKFKRVTVGERSSDINHFLTVFSRLGGC